MSWRKNKDDDDDDDDELVLCVCMSQVERSSCEMILYKQLFLLQSKQNKN